MRAYTACMTRETDTDDIMPDNAFIETFNGSLREECLNLHWFETLAEARQTIEAWRIDYNVSRPHMALGNMPPAEYALQAANRCDPLMQTAGQPNSRLGPAFPSASRRQFSQVNRGPKNQGRSALPTGADAQPQHLRLSHPG